MYKITLSIIFAGFFAYACNFFVECGECFTPPDDIHVLFVDGQTGDNLFANGNYKTDSVKLYFIDGDTKKYLTIEFVPLPNGDTIMLANELSWQSVTDHRFYLTLNHADTDTIDLYTDKQHDECCTFYDQKSFEFNDKPVKDSLIRLDASSDFSISVFRK